MSLLRRIQEAAVDSSVDLATLLRMCKVLAVRLGSDEFRAWVDRELFGYDRPADLPEYRVLKVFSKGDFGGMFGSGLRNADIPLRCVPEGLRESLGHVYIVQPVAAMEALVGKDPTGMLREPWNPDIVAHVGDQIYERMVCMQAWKVVPATAFVAALDTVRTRVLNFVLEIEAANPSAGESMAADKPIPADTVHHIFNTYISGNVQNLASGSSNVSQVATWQSGVAAETFAKLLAAIGNSDMPADVRNLAAESVQGLRSSPDGATLRERYHSFMGVLADHMQVLGPIVGPFLPSLAAMIP